MMDLLSGVIVDYLAAQVRTWVQSSACSPKENGILRPFFNCAIIRSPIFFCRTRTKLFPLATLFVASTLHYTTLLTKL